MYRQYSWVFSLVMRLGGLGFRVEGLQIVVRVSGLQSRAHLNPTTFGEPYGWLSKLGSLFGVYVGYPKRDPNFDNHPYA